MAATATFADLLSQLGATHAREVQSARDECGIVLASVSDEYNEKLKGMSAEIGALRKQLGEVQETDCNGGLQLSNGKSAAAEAGVGVSQEQSAAKIENQGNDVEIPRAISRKASSSTLSVKSSRRVLHNLKPAWSRHAIWGTDAVTLPCSKTQLFEEYFPSILVPFVAVTGIMGCSGCIMFPHSHFRTVWDFTSLILVLGDILILPFLFAFDPPPTAVLRGFEWISLIFWTADMAQGPFLGYFRRGDYVQSRLLVLKHYLQTWFLVDVLVVIPEWFVVLLGDGDDSPVTAVAGAAKLFKTVRIARVLRLLRIPKLKRIIERLYDLSSNEFSFAMLSVVHLILFVLVLNHVVACVWYAVGRTTRRHGHESWISIVQSEEDDTHIYFLYLNSLHWSLTQFTPASMKVSACNEAETLVSIVVLFFAMIVFSSFVGSITNHITRLRSFHGETTKQLWLLRRFLRDHQVDRNLAQRIHKFVEAKLAMNAAKVQVNEIDVLSKLSPALSDELAYALHSKFICVHMFFWGLSLEMEMAVHRICKTALQSHQYATRELVFSAGDEGKHMFVVQSGHLVYNCAGLQRVIVSAELPQSDQQSVRWIAEAVLWTAWRHRGQLNVDKIHSSEVLVVDPAVFFDVMTKHPRSWLYASVYGEQFVTHLNSLSQVTDVIFEDIFYEEAMTVARTVVSNPWSMDTVKVQNLDATDEGGGHEEGAAQEASFPKEASI